MSAEKEVVYTVSREFVVVTVEDLRDIKRKVDKAPQKEKYMATKAYQFYGNLRRWQKQGLHFRYVSGPGTQHCTCGLVLYKNSSEETEPAVFVDSSVQEKFAGLELEQIQLLTGHVGLPSIKGRSVALIVNFRYSDSLRDYLWVVICQGCGDSLKGLRNSEAKSFVKAHNKSCRTQA